MLSDEVLDKVIERLTNRIEQGNTYVLEQIGKSIKKIGALSPSNAQQLGQLIKYGGDYDKITKKLAEITKMNVADIKKIFEEVAKNDYQFAKQFYDYRGQKFIPYDENMVLKTQVDALANMTAHEYANLSRSLAFTKTVNGKVVATPLAKAYQNTLDSAILNVSQGKTNFETEMYRVIKELANSGLKTIDYESGRSYRLDSAVRSQMRGALRNLHNETQEIIGKDFDADGVEISVHMNPAPDHAFVQGRQFSNDEFEKFQNDQDAKSYDGKFFPAISEETGHDRRAISEYNCYHYIFSIVLGVSEPTYSDDELQKIIDDNEKGFELDGKHYTKYEGTQMQRQLELEIRKAKDEQIMAKASGIPEDISRSQKRITDLTNKYKELNQVGGLSPKMERMRVRDYKRIKVDVQKYYNENLKGLKNGDFEIKNISKHFTERAIERRLYLDDAKDTFTNPLIIDKMKLDSKGQPSIRIIGRRSTIVYNPKTNTLITTYPTRKKYLVKK